VTEVKARIITVLLVAMLGGAILSLAGNSALPAAETTVAFSAGNLIRLHVLANSDGKGDQEVKLLVRDRILAETAVLLKDVNDRASGLRILCAQRSQLVAAAEDELARHGFPYRAVVEVGEFVFPERQYDFGMLPAGRYQAVRVILGQGQGRNWWCVLFPPVCHLTMADQTREETEPIRLRWKALEDLKARKDELGKRAWTEWAKWFQLATIALK
jgi:stage II sporulation protein R